jgi:hypothetical protein
MAQLIRIRFFVREAVTFKLSSIPSLLLLFSSVLIIFSKPQHYSRIFETHSSFCDVPGFKKALNYSSAFVLHVINCYFRNGHRTLHVC